MSSLRKNVASQHISFCLNAKADGTPVTAGGAGNVVIDGGAQAACAGTFTHKGSGQWDYAPTQAETNGTSIGFAFTGTGAIQVGMTFFTIGYDPTVANLPANLTQVNAHNVTDTASGVLDVNAKNLGGTAQTGRDIGASVLLSAGTGTGQLDFTSGVVKSNLVQILATALTETAGQIAAAFKKFFNVLTPTAQADNLPLNTDYTSARAAKLDDLDATISSRASATTLGSPAGASIAADIAAVKSDTGTILTDVNTGAGAIYTRLGAPAGASLAADIAAVKAVLPSALTGAGNIKADALALNGDTTAASKLASSADKLVTGTVGTGSTTTSIVTSALSPSNSVAGQFQGRVLIFDSATTTAALRGQATAISTDNGSGTLTVTALTTAPSNGDTFVIL